jgi:hypothetical protein
VINKNGKLKIRMILEERFDGKDTSVTLFYTTVDILDVKEGATISSVDTIKQYEIDLKAHGSATKQKVSLNTGGIYEGKNLQTETTTVILNAEQDLSIFTKTI